jgi:methionine synthase II (cobalamin-independent)
MSQSLKRSPPFRAEHMGSLLRPESLQPWNKNHLPKEEQIKAEDEAVKHIVETQINCGLHGINDGEFRCVPPLLLYINGTTNMTSRSSFWGSIFESWHGIDTLLQVDPDNCRSFAAGFVRAATQIKPGMFYAATGQIKHPGYSTFSPEIKYIQSIVPKEKWGDIKLTIPSPNWCHITWREGHAYPTDIYPNDVVYFKDFAAAYKQEIEILYKDGLRNIQFDDPNLTFFCSEATLKEWEEDRTNTQTADELFQVYINAYNDILAGRPADLHVGIHLCRGNFKSSTREGGYERIAETLFQKLDVDTFYLEYDTSRSGGFEPLRKLPANKNVILGLITTKDAQLENGDVLKEQVLKAAEIIAEGNGISKEQALKQIGISPQCGFSSIVEAPHVGFEEMVGKLRLIRRVADTIWPGDA